MTSDAPAQASVEAALPSGRSIYEVANQLGGYVDMSTPEPLASFLLRESEAATELAEEIVRLRTLSQPPTVGAEDEAVRIGTSEFMDPPDGGDVSVAEQVRRMEKAYKQRGKDIVDLMAALDAEKRERHAHPAPAKVKDVPWGDVTHAQIEELADRLMGRGVNGLTTDDWPTLVNILEAASFLRASLATDKEG